MDCEQFDKTTMDLLYGELAELNEAATLRHLHHCTRCRKIWEDLRATRESADIPLEEPPVDLFETILANERKAHHSLPLSERFSRAISITAGYAMRPQVAMAAILLLMIGSSLVFIRTGPLERGQVSVTELGAPRAETKLSPSNPQRALVFDRKSDEKLRAKRNREPSAESDNDGLNPSDTETRPIDPSPSKPENLDYGEAMSAYQRGQYAEAERLFSEIAASNSSKAASAALHEGHAARNGSGCQRAATLYDAVSSKYAGGTLAEEASWHAASCYRAMGQLRRALAHYKALQHRPAFAQRAKKAMEEVEAALALSSPPNKKQKSGQVSDEKTNTEGGSPAGDSEQPSDRSKKATAPQGTGVVSPKSAN